MFEPGDYMTWKREERGGGEEGGNGRTEGVAGTGWEEKEDKVEEKSLVIHLMFLSVRERCKLI